MQWCALRCLRSGLVGLRCSVKFLLLLLANRTGVVWVTTKSMLVGGVATVDHNTAASMVTSSLDASVAGQQSGRRGQRYMLGCLQDEQQFNRD